MKRALFLGGILAATLLTLNNVLPLVKSVHAERIRENYDIFDFELSHQEMKAIDSLPDARFGGNPDTVEF